VCRGTSVQCAGAGEFRVALLLAFAFTFDGVLNLHRWCPRLPKIGLGEGTLCRGPLAEEMGLYRTWLNQV